MKSYTTLPNYTYCVSTVAGTTVTTVRDGTTYTLLNLPGAGQGYFTPLSDTVTVSDDDAVVTPLPKDAPIGVADGGLTLPIPLPAADSPLPLLHGHIYTYEQGEAAALDWSALRLEDAIGTTAEIWLSTSDDPPEVSWPQDWVWRGTASDDAPPLLPGAKLCVFLLRRDAVGVTARLADVRGEERPYVQPVMTGFDTWSNTPSFGLKVSTFGAFGNDLSTTTNANGQTMYAWKLFTTVDNRYYMYFNAKSLTDYGPRELVMEFERPLKITKFRWANSDTGGTGWFSYDILADGVIIISDRTHWHNGTTNLVDIPVPRLNQRYALTYTLRLMPYNSGWTSGIFQPYGMIHIVGVY